MPEVYPAAADSVDPSTQGIELPEVGDKVKVSDKIDPEIAETAFDKD